MTRLHRLWGCIEYQTDLPLALLESSHYNDHTDARAMTITGARGVMMDQHQAAANQITVFYSYAHADKRLRKQLETHLGLLRQQGLIATWHDRQIVPGTDWAQEIDTHLATAHVILLLISPDFLASNYCYGVELRKA